MSSILNQLEILRQQIHKNVILKKYSDIVEETLHIHIEYILAFLALIPTIMLFYGYGAQSISDLVGFLFPMYATLLSIESKKKEETSFWLSYWVVYGFIYILEEFLDYIMYWLPFYFPLKVVTFLYLYLPHYSGAKVVYSNLILPYFKHVEAHVDEIVGYK